MGPHVTGHLLRAGHQVRAALTGRPVTLAGTGGQQRNYVYLEDLADAHVRALAPAAADQVIALEGGTPVPVREIAGTVRELVAPVPAERVPARAADYQGVSVSNRLAKELLHWSPQTSSGAGLRRYPGWLNELPQEGLTRAPGRSASRRTSGTAQRQRCPGAGEPPPAVPLGAPPARPREVPDRVPPARRTARRAG